MVGPEPIHGQMTPGEGEGQTRSIRRVDS